MTLFCYNKNMENNSGNNITIDQLAMMVQKGFEGVDKRFDTIERILSDDYGRRIEKLETEMKELRTALSLK